MKKPNIFAMAFLTGLVFYITLIWGVIILLTSCQSPPDPLRDAEFDCTVIYKGFAHEVHINCKDSLYKFRCEKYSGAFKEKDTIYEPLNK